MELSGFNPPPPQAQFAGDFFYIHLKTLENLDLHITACANGFFVNQSKVNCYNPSPQNGKPTYISLLDLLVASSEKFSALLNRVTDANPASLL
jgi:protein TIF31